LKTKNKKNVVIIVAHPDDETLWAGGTILSHLNWACFIVCLCRKGDEERSARFYKALEVLKAKGVMGDMDDGPEQNPLDEKELESCILELLPDMHFDLVISHKPTGEYTRHIRHEEVSKAVLRLWNAEKILASELWAFAYEDGNKEYYPRPVETADIYKLLTRRIWLRKYSIIREVYGFDENSWEAKTSPKAESFWKFSKPYDAKNWLKKLAQGIG
jgi:LmbE family N-acetylglucosaminyl deacetylase